MTMPIFKLAKVKHLSDKARKDFILDVIFIQVGGGLLNIGLTESFSKCSDVKQLHKNKNRKEYRKVKALEEQLQKEASALRERLSDTDKKTIYHKTTLLNSTFIRKIGLTNKKLNLEYIGICILDAGLNRKRRKTQRYQILDKFCDYKLLYKEIGMVIEKAGIKMTDELVVANEFVNDVRY